MKKLLTISLALLFLGALAVPASAFVFVQAEINKEKSIEVIETIFIDKFVWIDVSVDVEAAKGAESLALLNQDNFGNKACENCAEKTSLIVNSINENRGIIHANQATGNMYNQGNVVALAVDVTPGNGNGNGNGEPSPDSGFANAEASMAQHQGNFYYDGELVVELPEVPFEIPREGEELLENIVDSANILFRDATIRDSVNNNTGIVGMNQGAGNINNQGNNVSIAVSFLGGVALSEADLGQHTGIDNDVYETETVKSALIVDSINGNRGVVHVNQSSGNIANQGNNLALSAAITR